MLKSHQMQTMLELQDGINTKVNPQWVMAGNNWMLACAMEIAEAIDHHGWKWWKKSEMNLPLLQNELIDYWHFALSQSIVNSDGNTFNALYWVTPGLYQHPDVLAFDGKGYVIAEMGTVDKLFLLVGLAAAQRFEYYLFESIMKDCDLTWEELYKQYICKNVLNVFRQDHGYKEGTYHKNWYDGREDNLHMIDIMNEHSNLIEDKNFASILEDGLSTRYAQTLNQR